MTQKNIKDVFPYSKAITQISFVNGLPGGVPINPSYLSRHGRVPPEDRVKATVGIPCTIIWCFVFRKSIPEKREKGWGLEEGPAARRRENIGKRGGILTAVWHPFQCPGILKLFGLATLSLWFFNFLFRETVPKLHGVLGAFSYTPTVSASL